jgi:CubicO group peptidase (beta-lactamase class C family)
MRKHLASIGFAFVLLFVEAGRTAAETAAKALSPAPPAAVGLSAERLERLSTSMRQAVDDGRAAGIVTLVARRGRISHFAAFGKQDVESGVPMARDTIFRIASQSKAVTSVAAMILVEEGKLLLSDPVSRYVPVFKKTTVRVPPPEGAPRDAPGGTVPAKREITIRDLLTHTSGVSYGSGPLEAQYKAANVLGFYFADKDEPIGAAIERLAALPFEGQPGEKYIYGFSTDILGYVVEKAAGQGLDEVFRTRIFEPLRMTDTYFFLPKDKASRLAAVYSLTDGKMQRAADAGTGQGDYVNGPRRCFSGGAGLVSTANDYARFLEMLRNGGELDGVRVLSRKSVELMTANQLGTLYQEGRFGFGLGFEITEHVGRAGRYGSVGEFGWGGAYHTSYWVDPAEGLVAVFMTQLLPSGGSDLHGRFRSLLYQAIVDPAGR